ncbi:phosphoribosyltransferase family protein [Bosea sp. BIWAKO-01]|uniref:phosphoribosyltransferase family protein n=1 Tax=Bosea sp. BIWAKO-01 TaxID=506668 RepID=UPI00086EE5B6|nr:phosphoribosyltransferase family protein [Bosea sp. BIWAKO-01]GAU84837.1 adenine phosphoribosyltransferase [Bosea sp. BIWAKO-01]
MTITAPEGDEARELPHRRWKNYPVAGIDYPDASPMSANGRLAQHAVDALAGCLPSHVEVLAGIDVGGLGFAGALAYRSALGFFDVRKIESIKADVIRGIMANYDLGNGIAISKSMPIAGRSVAVLDDCLMTGGTALAAAQLIRRLGGNCQTALFVFELEGMGGRERLESAGLAVHSLQIVPRTEATGESLVR